MRVCVGKASEEGDVETGFAGDWVSDLKAKKKGE